MNFSVDGFQYVGVVLRKKSGMLLFLSARLTFTILLAPHSLVPQFVIRTGRGVGPLGVDHELFVVWVFVQPCGGGEKVRPALVARGYLRSHVVCQLTVLLEYGCQFDVSFPV